MFFLSLMGSGIKVIFRPKSEGFVAQHVILLAAFLCWLIIILFLKASCYAFYSLRNLAFLDIRFT